MTPSFVCYADVLGYSQLSKKAIISGNGEAFLKKLRNALSNAYERIKDPLKDVSFMKKLDYVRPYSIKIFTDNIVIVYPLSKPYDDYVEGAFEHTLSIFSEFQAGLAMEGFFLRGGIAYGELYTDDDIVFGEALLDATEQDKSGGAPRISLTPSVLQMVKKYFEFYTNIKGAPHYEHLLKDADGTIFLDYLREAFCAFPDGGIFFDLIEGHQKNIIKGLEDYKANPGVRAKYEWLARYHNFVCREFANAHPIRYNPDCDEEIASAHEEAQKLLDYIIDIESLAATPCRLKSLMMD